MRQLIEATIIDGIERGEIQPRHVADVLGRCRRAAERIALPSLGHPDIESAERERENIARIDADAQIARYNVDLLERIVRDRGLALPETLSEAMARQAADEDRYA